MVLLSGCVSNQFMQVASGPVVLKDLTVGNNVFTFHTILNGKEKDYRFEIFRIQ